MDEPADEIATLRRNQEETEATLKSTLLAGGDTAKVRRELRNAKARIESALGRREVTAAQRRRAVEIAEAAHVEQLTARITDFIETKMAALIPPPVQGI